MDTGLKGQKVLILGSSRGIGLGIAECFVREGSDVMVTGRNLKDLERAVLHLKSFHKGTVQSYQGDMFQERVIEDLQKTIKKKLGSLDHLVCNIGSGRSVLPGKEDITEVKRMVEINFFHAVRAIHSFRFLLRRNVSAKNNFATITLIGSICSRQVIGCPAAYAAAKAALVAYAKNVAAPLAKEGIRVNVVSPGNIFFPGSVWDQKLRDRKDEVNAMLQNKVPLKKFGTPEDVGSAVIYLASRCAGFMTGAELVVDGGQSN